jgi:hypothetical protein
MAQRNEQVLDWVRQELNRDPGLGSGRLFEMAREREPSLSDATLPQFHARYVLPVKRERAAAAGGGAKAGRRKGARKSTRKQQAEAPSQPQAAAPRAKSSRGRKAASARDEGPRERIRSVFLEFAREFAEADSRTQIVQVLSRVDEYVDRVIDSQG